MTLSKGKALRSGPPNNLMLRYFQSDRQVTAFPPISSDGNVILCGSRSSSRVSSHEHDVLDQSADQASLEVDQSMEKK